MVADIDWYFRAVDHLNVCQRDYLAAHAKFNDAGLKRQALTLIPGTVRNQKTFDKAIKDFQAAATNYHRAKLQVTSAIQLIEDAKFYPPRISWRARLYWWYCCIKYRNL